MIYVYNSLNYAFRTQGHQILPLQLAELNSVGSSYH